MHRKWRRCVRPSKSPGTLNDSHGSSGHCPSHIRMYGNWIRRRQYSGHVQLWPTTRDTSGQLFFHNLRVLVSKSTGRANEEMKLTGNSSRSLGNNLCRWLWTFVCSFIPSFPSSVLAIRISTTKSLLFTHSILVLSFWTGKYSSFLHYNIQQLLNHRLSVSLSRRPQK